jgi:hypothetical protein
VFFPELVFEFTTLDMRLPTSRRTLVKRVYPIAAPSHKWDGLDETRPAGTIGSKMKQTTANTAIFASLGGS